MKISKAIEIIRENNSEAATVIENLLEERANIIKKLNKENQKIFEVLMETEIDRIDINNVTDETVDYIAELFVKKAQIDDEEIENFVKSYSEKGEYTNLNEVIRKYFEEKAMINDEFKEKVRPIGEMLKDQIDSLQNQNFEKQKIINKVKRLANNVLYFDDSSDYCCALWDILRTVNPDLGEYPILNYIEEEK